MISAAGYGEARPNTPTLASHTAKGLESFVPPPAIRWDSLAADLDGSLMLPGAPHYDNARRVWNGMITRQPAAIAVCANGRDVATAIQFATVSGLKVSVRGGGHHVGGRSVQDKALMVDLSGMRSVAIDPRHHLAAVKGGATWRNFDVIAGAFGMATTGGMVSSTGVAGLTLGGGIGWLARKFGLASDNLLAAEVVLASGELVQTSENKHPDLFHLLRGAGAGLGVVTQFDFRIHSISTVLCGGLWCRSQRAAQVLRAFRAFALHAPDELTMVASAITAPPAPFVPPALHGQPMIVIGVCWCGEVAAGERVLAPLRTELRAEADLVSPMAYPDFQASLDPTAPYGLRNYWRSTCLDSLEDAAIDWLAAQCLELPSPESMIHVHQLKGAIARGSAADASAPLRQYDFVVNAVGTWASAAQDEAVIHWARRCGAGVAGGQTRRAYANFAGEDAAQPEQSYSAEILQQVNEFKRRHDPDGLFV